MMINSSDKTSILIVTWNFKNLDMTRKYIKKNQNKRRKYTQIIMPNNQNKNFNKCTKPEKLLCKRSNNKFGKKDKQENKGNNKDIRTNNKD